MYRTAALFINVLLLSVLYHASDAQVSGGLNFSNRRILPPRILAPENQQQQQQQQPQRQSPSISGTRQRQPFNPFAQNPAYYNSAYLTERIGRLEADMGQISRALNAIPSTIRMTVTAYITERLNRVQEDIQGNTVRIDDNQEKVDQVDQELKYIKNSNANMQKRMDRIEASQQEQGETISDIKRILESLQQTQSPGSSVVGQVNPTPTRREMPEKNRLDELESGIANLSQRLNDTDSLLDGYDESIRSFTSSILILSDKTNQLESNSVSNIHWLSSIRTDVQQLGTQLDVLEAARSKSDNIFGVSRLNNLQSSVQELNSTLRSITETQQFQTLTLNNLTSVVSLSSQTSSASAHGDDDYEYEDANSNSDMIFELATSIATIEESVKLLKEGKEIFKDEIDRKISVFSRDLSTNEQNINNLEGRVQSLEESSVQNSYRDPPFVEETFQNDSDYQSDLTLLQNIENRLEILNQTVIYHSKTLTDLEPVLNQKGSSNDLLAASKEVATAEEHMNNSASDNDYFISDDLLHEDVVFSNGLEDYVTLSFLEKQLETFRRNLTAQQLDPSLSPNESREQILPYYAQERSSGGRGRDTNSATSIPEIINGDRFTVLQTNIDVLNTSVAVQGSMLQQAIRAMGDYDRRLRQAEEKRKMKAAEFQQIRHLVVNATNSFSSMSFTVAQNELTIANMAQNARIGDDMLLDLSDQMFRNEIAIDNLNATLGLIFQKRSVAENSALQSASLSGDAVHRINRQESSGDTQSNNYVTRFEFGGIADALAVITGRVERLDERQETIKSSLDDVKNNASLSSSLEQDLFKIWTTINSTNSLLEFLQNVIASISGSNVEIKQKVTSLGNSVSLLQNNSSGNAKTGLYGDEFIHLLDTSVRDLRIEVNEQRTWLVNQRRRIRQLEDESLQTYAQISDVAILNDTVRRRLKSAETAIRSLASDSLSREMATPFITSNLTESIPSNQSTVQQLEEDVAYLMNKLNKQKPSNLGNNTNNNRLVLDEEFRTVPLTLRILEGQMQDFQEALQTLAALDAKVDTLRSIQSSVLKNSRDITTFHESVQNVEGELTGMKRKLTVVEFSTQRLNSYQDDLRSRLNITKHILDRTNDATANQGQNLRLLSRFLEGNATGLRGRIAECELRLDDQDVRLTVSSRLVSDLGQDVRQQEAADLLRHNDLDNRMLRDEKRIENLEVVSTQNGDTLVTLTRSLSEETNSRRSAVEGFNNDVQSLRQTVSTLESQATNTRQSLTQQSRQTTEFHDIQNRHSDEIQRLQNLHRTVSDSLQSNNRLLQSKENEQQSLNNKINNNKADISALRDSINTQDNTLLSVRQSNIVVNDEINSLQQSTQSNNAFARRAEQALEKLGSDIAFILEHSSNQSVAIQKLKLRVSKEPQKSFNTTHELMSEVQLLGYNLRGVSDEMTALKRQVSVRESAAILLEERIGDVSTRALESDNQARSTTDTLDRLRSDVRRYGDRVRILESNVQEHAVARNDLQQVVISNRNELSVVNDMKSTLNQLRQDVANTGSRQENRSSAYQLSIDEAKLQITSLSSQVSEHDGLLRTLRQERISAEASMDYILRSSSSLEQLLRTTVTDLTQLKRDFDASSDVRNAVPRIQRIVSTMERDFLTTKQAVAATENKLSRMQDLVDRTTASVTNLVTATQNRYRDEQSRDQSRTNDLRELRENFSRSSVLLRTIQNELRQHNERIRMLNQRVIDVDNRVSTSVFQISTDPPEDTNLNSNLGKESDLILENSGWIPIPVHEMNVESVERQTHHNKSSVQSDINLFASYLNLLERIDGLSTNISNMIDNFDLKLDALKERLNEGKNASVSNFGNDSGILSNSKMATLITNLTLNLESKFEALALEKKQSEEQQSGSGDQKLTNIDLIHMFSELQNHVANLTKEINGQQERRLSSPVTQHFISKLVLKLADLLENTAASSVPSSPKEPQSPETDHNVSSLEIGYDQLEEIYESSSDTYETGDYSSPDDYANHTVEVAFNNSEEDSLSTNGLVKNMTLILRQIANVLEDVEVESEVSSSEFVSSTNFTLSDLLNRLTIVEDSLLETRNEIESRRPSTLPVFTDDIAMKLDSSPTKNDKFASHDQILEVSMNDTVKRQEITAIHQNLSSILNSLSQFQLFSEQQQRRLQLLQSAQESAQSSMESRNSSNNLNRRLKALENQFQLIKNEDNPPSRGSMLWIVLSKDTARHLQWKWRQDLLNDAPPTLDTHPTNLRLFKKFKLAEWKEFRVIQDNISLIFEALSQYQIASQQQQHHLLHLLFNQNMQSEKLENVLNATDKLELELDLLKNHLPQQQHLAEERLQARIDAAKDQLIVEQLLTVQQLYDVMRDVTALNTTVNHGNDVLTNLQKGLNLTLNRQLPRLVAATEQNTASISELQKNQMDQKQNIEGMDLTLTLFFEQLDSLENDVNNVDDKVELVSNDTRNMIDEERAKSLAVSAEIQQKLASIDLESQEIISNITNILRAQSTMDIRLLYLNQSAIEDMADFNDLQRETEILITAQDDLGLTLTQHSMELRGLSRTIRTFEDLVGTLSDTVALQGKKMTMISGNTSQTVEDNRDISFLSQTISNHSVKIETIENQISILQNRVKTQSSVRIVVPPSNTRNENADQPRTTTEETTTFTSPVLHISPPFSVSVTSLRFDEFIISWVPSSDPNISGYRVILENTQDQSDMLQIAAVAPPITATGLLPSTRYLIRVHSVRDQQLSLPASVAAETGPRPTLSTSIPKTTTTTTTTTTPLPIHSTTPTPDPNSIYSGVLVSSLPETVSTVEVFKCNFDNASICGFTNDLNDEFDWTHWNGSTPSSDTGPSNDHTTETNSGLYMFIEASRPRQLGQVARLLSPVMQATDGQCLHFYYHMYGVGTGDLNVVLLSADGSFGRRVWGESGDWGNEWKRGKVTIAFDTSFRIAFEAVRGSDYHGDTAIDDVTVQAGACPQPLLQCGFENADICGFIQDYDDDFDWQRNNGATTSADTGPVNDHTLGTHAGYYLFLESSNPRTLEDRTRLSSPMLRPTSGQCLKFYYHMHGIDIGSLNVYMRLQSNMRDLVNPMWTKSGPQGDAWLLGHVTLVSSDSFQIVLEGVRGDDYHGDIAIDDVSITDGMCDQPICSTGVRFGSLCYEVKTNLKSYQDAADICAASGGLLAAVKTKSQQSFIAQTLLDNEANKWQLFWIGLDDRNVEGRFMFSDNTPLIDAESSWDVEEPSDTIGDEDCVNMEYDSSERRWNDAQCSTELGFICQYSIGT